MQIIAEYIWIGGNGELRSKARTLILSNTYNTFTNKLDNFSLSNIPDWNYDGSSTGQASGDDSEVIIKPCSYYWCPFRGDNHILVMCDTYKPNGTPLKGNNRFWANKLFNKNLEAKPWYGIEQEFFMLSKTNNRPYKCWDGLEGRKQGQYYCSVGAQNAFGRTLIDKHYEYCLYAGLSISGINAEVAPAQWEYQIGPVEGIEAGDQLWISRYILQRLGEEFDIWINFEPKPFSGDWNGSGCHTNYSTENMRNGSMDITDNNNDNDNKITKSGLEYINEAIHKLSLNHDAHMSVYGTGNELRMTGKHETSRFDKFNSGVANRGASIRIPNETAKNNCGYFEDRRPSSNMDPYLVTGILFKTTVLDE